MPQPPITMRRRRIRTISSARMPLMPLSYSRMSQFRPASWYSRIVPPLMPARVDVEDEGSQWQRSCMHSRRPRATHMQAGRSAALGGPHAPPPLPWRGPPPPPSSSASFPSCGEGTGARVSPGALSLQPDGTTGKCPAQPRRWRQRRRDSRRAVPNSAEHASSGKQGAPGCWAAHFLASALSRPPELKKCAKISVCASRNANLSLAAAA